MKIICAGVIKTGTKSMREALEILGYENVQDIFEQMAHNTKIIEKAAYNQPISIQEYQRSFGNVDSIMDGPFLFRWKELLEAFPDAKVVLTVRDDSQTWLKSVYGIIDVFTKNLYSKYVLNILFNHRFCPTFKLTVQVLATTVYKALHCRFDFTDFDPDIAIDQYKKHNADVIANCPTDKLLVFNCNDGWAPLCKFLEKDVPDPDAPFPHRNIKHSIHTEIRDGSLKYSANVPAKMNKEMGRFIVGLICVFVLFASILFRLL